MAEPFSISQRKPKQERPIQKAKKVIRAVVEVLREKSFKREVGIKAEGGSVGQGTAVTHHYDLDLVLYSHDIKYKEVVKDGDPKDPDWDPQDPYRNLKDKIQAYLARELEPNYTFIGETAVAVKFKYRLPERGYLDVDLLLSPHWKSRESYFHDLAQIQPPLKRLTFSVSASKYQRDFIKEQHQRVHELIRRAKAWRNVTWGTSGDGRPKSYLVSLLVITAYDRTSNKHRKSFKSLAKEVGEEMIALLQEITSEDDKLNLVIPGTSPAVADSALLPPCPRIVDPGNPANNLFLSGVGNVPYGGRGVGDWGPFRDKISSFDITTTAERMMEKVE